MSKEEAVALLIKESTWLAKHARWVGFRSKLNGLRKALIALRMAEKKEKELPGWLTAMVEQYKHDKDLP